MTLGRQILAALAFTLVTSAVVYAATTVLPKTFESEQALMFPNSGSGNLGSVASQVFQGTNNAAPDLPSFGLPGSISSPLVGSSVNVAMGIMESRSCREFVCDKLGLQQKWRMSKQKVVAELKKKCRIKLDENGFVVITAQAEQAELAQQLVQSTFEYLDKGAEGLTRSFSKRNRVALEQRLAVSKADTDRARLDFVRTSTDSPYVDKAAISGLLTSGLQRLGEARAAMLSAEGKVKSYSAMINAALARGDDVGSLQAVGGGTVDAALQTLAQELSTRRLEFETAQRLYTQESPEYKLALQRVKSGRQAVAETVRQAKASLANKSFAPLIPAQSELDGLRQSVKIFEASLQEYKRMALRAPRDASLLQMKEAQFQTSLRNWQNLEFQLAQAVINEDRDPARYEVVDDAVVNPEPIAPRKGLITGGWFVASLALCTWVILRKRMKFVE